MKKEGNVSEMTFTSILLINFRLEELSGIHSELCQNNMDV